MLKQFTAASAASKVRSSEGCWTCRLRRKKCDEVRPVCQACALLEITCHYSDVKPEWMDGGARQKEMADRLKAEVKKQANCRREKRYLSGLEHDGGIPGEQLQMSGPKHRDADGEKGPRSSTSEGEADSPPSPKLFHLLTPTLSTGSATSPPGGSTHDTSTAGSTRAESVFQIDQPMTTVAELTPASSIAGMDIGSLDIASMDISCPSETECPQQQTSPHESASLASPPSNFVPNDSHINTTGWAVPQPELNMEREPILPDDRDLNFVMIYLDYVFPFLFPFYRPPLLEGGRGWLLCLLKKNKALFHTAMSMSSYFFSVVLASGQDSHSSCKNVNWEQLQKQQEMALMELQKDMFVINLRGTKGYLKESALVMESIIQLLVFDVATGGTPNWPMHLDAAIALFEQILPEPFQWNDTLLNIGAPDIFPILNRYPWTPDQAALRFYTANLLYQDVIASTALGRAPRLQKYHPALLEVIDKSVPEEQQQMPLDFSDFTGAQNWIIRVIGEIATLAAWKKDQKRNGSLSVTTLVAKAMEIENAIRTGLSCIEAHFPLSATESNHNIGVHDPQLAQLASLAHMSSDPLNQHRIATASDVAFNTRVWAYAALLYLSVVVSGWQPSCPEVRESVQQATNLLKQLHTGACLFTLVWPFTVIGCLATPDQEQVFRDLINKVGALRVFGSLQMALSLLENVWQMRDSIDESWDISVALNVMGHPRLII